MSKKSRKKGRKGKGTWLDAKIEEINATLNEELYLDGGDYPEDLPLIDDAMGTDVVKWTKPAKKKKKKTTGFSPRCLESHPILDIDPGKPGLPGVRGGSCSRPIKKDGDIYIGFDHSMTFTSRQFPWTAGYEVQYLIVDRAAPKHAESFIKLVDWTLEQIVAGKLVHAGCIGGHGRTGLFLAALVARHTGRADAITYVRENYCKKAVESKEQVAFLAKHFGCDTVEPSKKSIKFTTSSKPTKGYTPPYPALPKGLTPVYPIQNSSTVWGDNATWDED